MAATMQKCELSVDITGRENDFVIPVQDPLLLKQFTAVIQYQCKILYGVKSNPRLQLKQSLKTCLLPGYSGDCSISHTAS